MFKALLGSSALAALAFLYASSAPAQAEATAPTLKINGFSNANAYFYNQTRRDNGRGGPQPHLALDASDLYLTIAGRTASGLEYKYKVTLNVVAGEDIVDSNYIELNGKFGVFQVGNVSGPTNTMVYDASRIIGGTGGFEGGFTNVFNVASWAIFKNDNIGDPGKATKVAYYTPEFGGGFVIGVAYTPNTDKFGSPKVNNQSGNGLPNTNGNRGVWNDKGRLPFGLRNVSAGITYKKEIGKWGFTLSAAGVTEKSYYHEPTQAGYRISLKNANSFQTGAIISYDKFQFGLGYLDNGTSRLPRTAGFLVNGVSLGNTNQGNAGRSYNVGVGYTFGAYKIAAAYQKTSRKTDATQKATNEMYTATLDVVPFQGFKGYVEVDHIRSRSNATAVAIDNALLAKSAKTPTVGVLSNTGTVLILGTAVSF